MLIKINAKLFKQSQKVLKHSKTNFYHEFNNFMLKSIKIGQVAFALEEYDTKDLNNYQLSLNQLDQLTLTNFLKLLHELWIPLNEVVNGYCRRVILYDKIPRFVAPRYVYKHGSLVKK